MIEAINANDWVNFTIFTVAIAYMAAGVTLAIVIYHNDNANMKNLGDTFWYKIVRSTILVYSVLFGPVVVVTFVALYIVIAIAGALLKLVYTSFIWEKPTGTK
jgi:hypothetical protein